MQEARIFMCVIFLLAQLFSWEVSRQASQYYGILPQVPGREAELNSRWKKGLCNRKEVTRSPTDKRDAEG